jgi:Mg2+ and Co2+ transporter CorA
MSDDGISLEFIGRKMDAVLAEARQSREGQQDLARTLRALNDTLLSMNRTMSAIDRRLSDVKDDLETTIRMELVGHRAVTDDKIENGQAEMVEKLTRLFDERDAPKEKT